MEIFIDSNFRIAYTVSNYTFSSVNSKDGSYNFITLEIVNIQLLSILPCTIAHYHDHQCLIVSRDSKQCCIPVLFDYQQNSWIPTKTGKVQLSRAAGINRENHRQKRIGLDVYSCGSLREQRATPRRGGARARGSALLDKLKEIQGEKCPLECSLSMEAWPSD